MPAEWHLHKIPKIAHFYWGHDYLPWVRWLTLETFRYHNPDWDMVFWQPTHPVHVDQDPATHGPDYLPRLGELGVVRSFKDADVLAGVNLDAAVPSIHVREQVKGDYLRLWLLDRIGGLSCDMDILFWKSMSEGAFNRPEHHLAESGVIRNMEETGIYYWGFMLGALHGAHFGTMWEAAKQVPVERFQLGMNFYAVAGHLAGDLWPVTPPGMINMPFHTVYDHDTNFAVDRPLIDPPARIGVHWHGSGTYGTFLKINEDTFVQEATLMHSCIARALRGMGK